MEGNGQNESTLPAKDLFRIGEVSRLTATKQFVLRYWESEFPMLQHLGVGVPDAAAGEKPEGAPAVSPSGHRHCLRDQASALRRRLHDRRRATPPARPSCRTERHEGRARGVGREL